jgi:hypothetical protein
MVHNQISMPFILALRRDSLKHLSWQNPKDKVGKHDHGHAGASPLRRVLEHTGSTLRPLEYWTEESSWDSRPPSVPTLGELHAVVELAPNLETLTLNLLRDNNNTVNGGHPQWPWVTLELLATGLPDLTDLTIYFELASECHRQSLGSATRWRRWLTKCEGECIMVDRYAQPMLNKTASAELTGFLQRHKTGQPLKSVSFRSGDWSPPWDGPLRDEQKVDWR